MNAKETAMMDAIYQRSIDFAKEEFWKRPLAIGDLICSTTVENPRIAYKVFSIDGYQVNIALPDMVMIPVHMSTLYRAADAIGYGSSLIANVRIQMRENAAINGTL